MNFTAQTFKLQDGNLCNPKRRLKKQAPTLLEILSQVKDGRQAQGKRHSLVGILWLVSCGLTVGRKNLAECLQWGQVKKNKKFLTRMVEFPHGLPHATTISRAFQVCDVESLTEALNAWYRQVFGIIPPGECASMDGKTMRGVHGDRVVNHIFSLVTHKTQRPLGQVGVETKENEITACPRLLAQAEADLPGLIVTADALLTQRRIGQDLRVKQAHYLLLVKDNQSELKEVLRVGFADPKLKKETHQESDYTHGRELEVTVEISQDFDMEDLQRDWQDIAWTGRIIRQGRRPYQAQGKRGTRIIMKPFYEETYFISSIEGLTAKQAAQIIRGHWKIENNLHWQKDWSYLEDRQTLRKGKAPQVMTLLKSLWISLLHQLNINKISETLHSFLLEPRKHRAFLQKVWVIA